eukprot:tig00021348_g20551.t1
MGGGLSAEKHSVPEVGAADVARVLLRSTRVVVLTGGGPRAAEKEAQIRSVASIDVFRSDPSAIWKAIREHVRGGARPDRREARADLAALAQLEQLNLVHAVVTQSVDGCHLEAGSKHVVEVDGSFMRARCTQCDATASVRELNILKGRLPPRCDSCDGLLRPDVALAGESKRAAERQLAQRELAGCDCVLLLGVENPSTELPSVAKAADAVVIEMGAQRTDFTGKMADLFAPGAPEALLPEVLAEVRRRLWHEFRIFAEGVDADDEAEGDEGAGEGPEGDAGGPEGGARSRSHGPALDTADGETDSKVEGLRALESGRVGESVMGSARSGRFSARSFQQAGAWTDRSARAGPGGGSGFMSARGGPKASARGGGDGTGGTSRSMMVPDSARSGVSDASMTETARAAKLAALKKKAWGAGGGLGAPGPDDDAGGWEDGGEESPGEEATDPSGPAPAAAAAAGGGAGGGGAGKGGKKMTKAALKAQSERAVFGGAGGGAPAPPQRKRFEPGLGAVPEVGPDGACEELALYEEAEELAKIPSAHSASAAASRKRSAALAALRSSRVGSRPASPPSSPSPSGPEAEAPASGPASARSHGSSQRHQPPSLPGLVATMAVPASPTLAHAYPRPDPGAPLSVLSLPQTSSTLSLPSLAEEPDGVQPGGALPQPSSLPSKEPWELPGAPAPAPPDLEPPPARARSAPAPAVQAPLLGRAWRARLLLHLGILGPGPEEGDEVEGELRRAAAREREAEALVAQETAAAIAEARRRLAESRARPRPPPRRPAPGDRLPAPPDASHRFDFRALSLSWRQLQSLHICTVRS